MNDDLYVIGFIVVVVGLIVIASVWPSRSQPAAVEDSPSAVTPPTKPQPQFTTELEALISIERQLKLLNFRMFGLIVIVLICF